MSDRAEGKILSLVHAEIAVLVGKDWKVGEGMYQTDHWKCGSGGSEVKARQVVYGFIPLKVRK